MKACAGIPTVEALLARCLSDPEFLESAAENPDRLLRRIPEHIRPKARGLDFQKLWSFSGFIGKVQHNYLWEHFPVTRRLLALRGNEHAVFGEYRKLQLSPIHLAADRPARIRRFADFFDGYLKQHPDSFARTVFTHERILWELRSGGAGAGQASSDEVDSAGLSWQDFQRAIPRIRANVRIAKFNHDPGEAVARVLDAAQNSKLRIRSKKVVFVYQLDAAGQLRLSQLDALSALVLAAAGSAKTVRHLISKVRLAGLQDVPPRAFRELLDGAVSAGFLRLEHPTCE